ncbi:bifunctional glycogen debranching protein GlgX/4-alpha-glucanotransferase [Desulfosporosinus sp. Sb-LF]|uniref:bifunctional glycogen debranching protein GlgX/4-alpha-glucanotransferase n=1 Tax=Desulfosporosinus sp. Sb-LF TaxID=2560027 RepID=UPI00107F8FDB|nr:bifunctional glycogen debranching protein GlgX/4-alpha-glucanotransferase [Desulfosporosinus sp. Sb-LF]TGE33262.1 bifunctional glycogen debranching protein GlgX/4-alpha-glucanotransferase [Desulfosporosinus sp. Sb-LF]
MLFEAYHNSHDLFYREPFGAVTCGQQIILRLTTFSTVPIETCVLRLWEKDRDISISMHLTTANSQNSTLTLPEFCDTEKLFEGNYAVPHDPGLIWYYFIIRVGAQTYYYGNNSKKLGGQGQLWEQEPPSYQITVYNPVTIPEWYKRGMMYQVFVDRFCHDHENKFTSYPRKNALLHANWSDLPIYIKDEQGRVTDWDFFGGTLQGVLEKLPYFKELGISILYLNPIFDAPSNHKYDTADYHRIDPMYGDDVVFKRLIDTARENGISIILDGVFSHTGSDSIYFNKNGNYPGLGAYQSSDSPYSTWYSCESNAQEYQCWWGVDSLPEVNELDPSYRQFIYDAKESVINKWMNMGVAGWRLDVADELPDEFIQELRQAIKSIYPEAVLIGEVWEDASNKISYGKIRDYFSGNELDATMNYPFRVSFLRFILGQSDSGSIHQEIMSLYENYPRENFYAAMNLIGSHDTARILTLFGDAPPEQSLSKTEQRFFRLPPIARQLAVQRLRMLSLVQMTFPGVPCIYYGDEAGVEGYADPYNRGTYPWGKEDRELMDWYRRILRLRAEYEVLKTGDFRPFYFEPDIYGFIRSGDKEEITILLNRHHEETKTLNLNTMLSQPSASVIDLIDGKKLDPETLSCLPINALSARALLHQKKVPNHLHLQRSCGVLLHISSLSSSWGPGDLGKEAYEFVDFLADSGHSLWQVLPLNPAGVGDCPYQNDSVFAGNPEFISLDHMISEGLLSLEETRAKYEHLRSLGLRPGFLYQALKELKHNLLQEAYQQFIKKLKIKFDPFVSSASPKSTYLSQESFLHFQVENKLWLEDYSLFRALKIHFGDVPWYDWEPTLASRETKKLAEYAMLFRDEMGFVQFLQYTFFFEWDKLKTYSKEKGVALIGDIPHFVAPDSCDVWVNRSLFVLDEHGKPAKTAGVPPDYFSKTGQSWGNPIYNWDALAITQYDWWKKRLKLGLELFDYIRLDHFRGFEAYWEIDAGEETAEKGRWIKGPGKRFFESVFETLGKCPFIVEDLGVITPEVNVLKQIFEFPGMKVLQFTPLQEISINSDRNFVYYSGTHDNNTLLGWYEKTNSAKEKNLSRSGVDQKVQNKQICRELIEEVYRSRAEWVILPMQDILGFGEEARMNVPGTIHGNWQWQLARNLDLDEIKIWLRSLAENTKRFRIFS